MNNSSGRSSSKHHMVSAQYWTIDLWNRHHAVSHQQKNIHIHTNITFPPLMLLHDSHAAQASKKQIQDVLNVSQFLGFIVYHSNPLLKNPNVELFSKTKIRVSVVSKSHRFYFFVRHKTWHDISAIFSVQHGPHITVYGLKSVINIQKDNTFLLAILWILQKNIIMSTSFLSCPTFKRCRANTNLSYVYEYVY